MAFPKVLYVRMDNSDKPPVAIAEESLGDAVQDGGTTRIGVYRLDTVRNFRKIVEAAD